MSYQRLEWDSAFFGFGIGRVEGASLSSDEALGATTSAADADGIACLYLLLDADEVESVRRATGAGFEPVDIRVELGLTLDNVQRNLPVVTRPATLKDLPAIEALAVSTMRDTRFLVDSRFPEDRAHELYATWARQGVLESDSHCAIVAEPHVAGFITCRIDAGARTGAIELIGVDRRHARRGLGRALVTSASAALTEAGCHSASVVTQGRNLTALRLYERCGYRVTRVGWWLHRWRSAATR